MPVKKRPLHFLLVAILLGGLCGYTIVYYPPNFIFIIHSLGIPLFPFVTVCSGVSIFFLISYLFKSMIQGLLLTCLLGTYLALRYVGLTNIFFLLLLIALFGSLEVFFFKKK